jgi:hypothetical protein
MYCIDKFELCLANRHSVPLFHISLERRLLSLDSATGFSEHRPERLSCITIFMANFAVQMQTPYWYLYGTASFTDFGARPRTNIVAGTRLSSHQTSPASRDAFRLHSSTCDG